MGKLQHRGLLALGCILYLFGLHLAYILVLVPAYAQQGFVYLPPLAEKLVFAWTTALAPALWLPPALRRPSQVVYWLLYLMVLVPSCLIPLYSLGLGSWQLAAQNLALLAAFALLGGIYLLPLPRLRKPEIPDGVFWAALAGLCGALMLYLLVTLGPSFAPVGLLDVYAVRADYRETLAAGRAADYAVNWLGYAILPFLIAQAFYRRRIWLLGLGLLGELELYAMTGFKTLALLPLLLGAVLLALQRGGRGFGPAAVWGAAVGAFVTTGAALLWREPLIAYLLVGRLIATPGLLAGYYFDFFSHNPQAQLGHSILAAFVPYPYEASPPFIIGRDYFGDPARSANAGIWADAFANFGYPGIFAFTLLLGLLLWLADAVSATMPDFRPVLMLSVAGFLLANSALLTALFTHGILLLLLLVYFLPLPGSIRAPGRQDSLALRVDGAT
jgi:hypothetical protein